MSPLETFLTFSFISTLTVALLATWLRFTSKPSTVKRA